MNTKHAQYSKTCRLGPDRCRSISRPSREFIPLVATRSSGCSKREQAGWHLAGASLSCFDLDRDERRDQRAGTGACRSIVRVRAETATDMLQSHLNANGKVRCKAATSSRSRLLDESNVYHMEIVRAP